jgi:Ser/Thr protein kinase RdoA (MazF antagonist)
VPGVTVPRVVAEGTLTTAGVAGFVLMTRLPGTRWADRRRALGAAGDAAVAREVGGVLRRLHGVRGAAFGGLAGGRAYGSAWELAGARRSAVLAGYVAGGGPSATAARLRAYIEERRDSFGSCHEAALCHRDLVDGNVLLAGADRVAGVVDLEAAGWDDPMSDLAQTRVHVRFHAPAHVADLLAGYGEPSADELVRLDVHDALHSARERAWIAADRPPGWRGAVAALDERLAEPA